MRKNLSLFDFFVDESPVDESWHIRLNTKSLIFRGGGPHICLWQIYIAKIIARFLQYSRKKTRMKKRILSVLISVVLLFGTIGVHAASIGFEDLKQNNDESSIYIEDC